MKQLLEYRHRAEDAERRARQALSDAERRGFEEVAEGWRRLEHEAERRLARGY